MSGESDKYASLTAKIVEVLQEVDTFKNDPAGIAVAAANIARHPGVDVDNLKAHIVDPTKMTHSGYYIVDAVKGVKLLSSFKEKEESYDIIDSLGSIYEDQIAVERATERFLFIVDQYQEQPHLLDPYLETLLMKCLGQARSTSAPDKVKHLSLKLLYMITKASGYKRIVRLMPHEVADLEPCLAMIAFEEKDNYEYWETRYMLMLWLSMVCMIPFDMVRLDSNVTAADGTRKKPIMERIIDVGKLYLDVSDKSRDAAAYMLSRFMTRPDVKQHELPQFLDWSIQQIKATDQKAKMTKSTGILCTLALLFKHGKREDLLTYAPTVLDMVISLELHISANTVVRKLGIKLITRLGLTFLKARVANWRYQRGSRSLAANLAAPSVGLVQSQLPAINDDEEYDIPEQVEEVIEQLLSGLKDPNTVVRWSAAKGIGRVTSRLPKELADDVVESLMELFTAFETDVSWHGGCLALAELGRRGLLVPERLESVVPVIARSLIYDEKRGNFSVGTHVRDAACYVCWSFARAYDPQDLLPYVSQIANALVVAFIFDREVPVRRAAAAAYQENVGRQGQFPHGIDILTTCDYFAVGNRNKCYLELSCFVAKYPEYTQSLIDHLVTLKISHWDKEIRILTSKAIHNLVKFCPQYISDTVISQLLEKCLHSEVNVRHGAILSLGEAVHALYIITKESNQKLDSFITSQQFEDMRSLVTKLNDGKLFKGISGELMRQAMCCFMKNLSLSQLNFHQHAVISIWQDLIDDCLMHIEPDVQKAAVACIPAVFTEYYSSGDDCKGTQDKIIALYLSKLNNNIETTRIGFAKAIGVLPDFMLAGQLDTIMTRLIMAMTINDINSKFAESRRDMLTSFTSICNTVGISKAGSPCDVLCSSNMGLVYDTLFTALTDYTLDSRGDVGAWVREAAMSGIQMITLNIINTDSTLIDEKIVRFIFCNIIQQATEKIDRIRAHAGLVFEKLLYTQPAIPYIPDVDNLKDIFSSDVLSTLNWAVPSQTFPLFTKLLSSSVYRYNVLLGLVISVGGLSESLVKHSSSSFLQYLHAIAQDEQAVFDIADSLLEILKNHQKNDRVTLPLLKTLDQLLANGSFDILFENEKYDLPVLLVSACKTEIQKCCDPLKLLASIDVFCDLLQFGGEVAKKCLSQLTMFMCHKYPIVRKTSANKLFETLLMLDDLVSEENLDQVQTLLSETQWDETIDKVRPVRNELCDLLGIPRPVIIKKKQPEPQ